MMSVVGPLTLRGDIVWLIDDKWTDFIVTCGCSHTFRLPSTCSSWTPSIVNVTKWGAKNMDYWRQLTPIRSWVLDKENQGFPLKKIWFLEYAVMFWKNYQNSPLKMGTFKFGFVILFVCFLFFIFFVFCISIRYL